MLNVYGDTIANKGSMQFKIRQYESFLVQINTLEMQLSKVMSDWILQI